MITSKDYNDIMKEEKDLKKRLKPGQTPEEKKKAQMQGQKYMKEILYVLHTCNQ